MIENLKQSGDEIIDSKENNKKESISILFNQNTIKDFKDELDIKIVKLFL